jgi:hypothetical protein
MVAIAAGALVVIAGVTWLLAWVGVTVLVHLAPR